MKFFRFSKQKYKNDISGKGAQLFGGRWNSIGIPALYVSESKTLCLAEISIHTPLVDIPADYSITVIEIPESVIISVLDKLPSDWNIFPHPESTKKIGNRFLLENRYLVLKVPSIAGGFNYLVNPLHKDFKKIIIIKSEKIKF